jgi:GDPmannose 4,6-dehydratase
LKNALICGVSGQDGAYLARVLLEKGYEVWGTSRDAQRSEFQNLRALEVLERVRLVSMAPSDFRSVLGALSSSEPAEVYYLAGQSSVGLSFDQPIETLESNALGVLNLLEAIRVLGKKTRLYHASSSECFGDVGQDAANEQTPFRPSSPYAVSKAAAHMMVANYRNAYGLFACNGILFNHDSPLRPVRFVTQKIVSAAVRIGRGSKEKLTLGRMDIVRDWGWAPEYVDAMWRMLQQSEPDDYIVATGEARSLEDFVSEAFALQGLDWREHVSSDRTLFRPTDLRVSRGDPAKAAAKLGWRASFRMREIVREMSQSVPE